MTNGITVDVKLLPYFASDHSSIDLMFLTRGDSFSCSTEVWSSLHLVLYIFERFFDRLLLMT